MAQFSFLFGHGEDQIGYGGSYIVNRDVSKVDLHEVMNLMPPECTSCMIELMVI